MKTIKITEKVHKELTKLISNVYENTGKKITYNETIMWLIIEYEAPIKSVKEYHFDDKDFEDQKDGNK